MAAIPDNKLFDFNTMVDIGTGKLRPLMEKANPFDPRTQTAAFRGDREYAERQLEGYGIRSPEDALSVIRKLEYEMAQFRRSSMVADSVGSAAMANPAPAKKLTLLLLPSSK